jgi:hypothetical protein
MVKHLIDHFRRICQMKNAYVQPLNDRSPSGDTLFIDSVVTALESTLKESSDSICKISPAEMNLAQIERVLIAIENYTVDIKDYCRRASSYRLEQPSLRSIRGEPLGIYVMEDNPPWKSVNATKYNVPGMITREEAQYYKWLAGFYAGSGRVVELGPWLGSSTLSIVEGLRNNDAFKREKLFVYDDFVWRKSWMDPYVKDEWRLENHQDFRHLFDKFTGGVASELSVQRARFAIYDGNESVDPLVWENGKIEMLFVDCGRTIEANQGWYLTLSKYFMPGHTLIVMQDWRLHREIPMRWYNQTELFTQSKADELQMVHELRDGGVATFIYKGR